MTDPIRDIYDAVGDEQRWQRVAGRFARGVTPEIAQHLEIARRAHEKHVRLASQLAGISAVYDQLGLGVLLVDGDRRIANGNRIARRLLDDASGIFEEGGCVRAVDPHDQAVLRTAIDDAIEARRRTAPFVLIRRPGGSPLSVFIVTAHNAARRSFEDVHAALLLLLDPDRPRFAGAATVKALFGFTTREAECAGLLIRGITTAEAARELGVTRATVRTFLARMAEKADSHTQSELVARLLAIPDLLAER